MPTVTRHRIDGSATPPPDHEQHHETYADNRKPANRPTGRDVAVS